MIEVRPADARATAARVLASPLEARTDLVGVHGPRPGSGRTDGEFWQDDAWFVKSRANRRYPEVAAARRELDRLDAQKRALGHLTPARTILAIAEAGDAFQLWTLAPRLVTLRERLDRARRSADWSEFAQALAGFAVGLGEALASSVEAGRGLDANPANFAPQGGRLRYIDDDVSATWDALGLEDAFAARFGEYEGVPDAVWAGYVGRFADEIAARLSRAGCDRLRLVPRLEAAAMLRRPARPHVERLRALLEARP